MTSLRALSVNNKHGEGAAVNLRLLASRKQRAEIRFFISKGLSMAKINSQRNAASIRCQVLQSIGG